MEEKLQAIQLKLDASEKRNEELKASVQKEQSNVTVIKEENKKLLAEKETKLTNCCTLLAQAETLFKKLFVGLIVTERDVKQENSFKKYFDSLDQWITNKKINFILVVDIWEKAIFGNTPEKPLLDLFGSDIQKRLLIGFW